MKFIKSPHTWEIHPIDFSRADIVVPDIAARACTQTSPRFGFACTRAAGHGGRHHGTWNLRVIGVWA